MKRLIAVILISQLILITAVLGVRWIGALALDQPRSFTSQLAHDSAIVGGGWCWRTVCPGSTTTALTPAIETWTDLKLIRDGNPDNSLTTLHLESRGAPRWTIIMLIRQPNRYVERIQIQPEMNASTIGELIATWGTPMTRRAEFAYGLWTTVICFQPRLCVGLIDNERQITLRSKVDFVEYAVADGQIETRLAQITRAWRGFTSAGR